MTLILINTIQGMMPSNKWILDKTNLLESDSIINRCSWLHKLVANIPKLKPNVLGHFDTRSHNTKPQMARSFPYIPVCAEYLVIT
eukprot:6207213-Pleurochrysis_carterae.AAC.1